MDDKIKSMIDQARAGLSDDLADEAEYRALAALWSGYLEHPLGRRPMDALTVESMLNGWPNLSAALPAGRA